MNFIYIKIKMKTTVKYNFTLKTLKKEIESNNTRYDGNIK